MHDSTTVSGSTRRLPAELNAESLFGALFDPDVWADPYPLFAELRAHDPVARLDDHLWVLSSHSAVHQVLRHPMCSSDERRSTDSLAAAADVEAGAAAADDVFDAIGDFMVFMDPPDHTRLRRLVARAFTPRQVRVIEPRAAAIVDTLLDAAETRAAADRVAVFDVVADLAHPLAVQVICELFGVPFADREAFSGWGAELARLVDPSVLRSPEQDARSAASADMFRTYFVDLIAARRSTPGDDLLSELIAAEEDGDRLSMDELVSVCLLVFVAGYETTVNLIGNGVVAAMGDRTEWDLLGRDPDALLGAVNEFLRFDAPVQMTIRVALEDMDVDGHDIVAGDAMINLLGAANRDPAVFAAPDALDLGRDDNPHLSFGGGIHHCLGAALARAEAMAAFRGLWERFPAMELSGEPIRRPTFTLRGFSSVPVRLHARGCLPY